MQLGDLVDDGPDTPGALAIMFRLIDEGRGMFLLGNHDYKLARGLLGYHVTGAAVERSLAELPLAMHRRTLEEIMNAPAWVATPRAFFVHGGFHPAMRRQAPPLFPTRRPDPLVARALFGQTTGRATEAGRPERLLDWIEDIPAGITVYCGHDRRSQDGRPYIRTTIPAAARCSSTPAPGKADICRGWILIRSKRGKQRKRRFLKKSGAKTFATLGRWPLEATWPKLAKFFCCFLFTKSSRLLFLFPCLTNIQIALTLGADRGGRAMAADEGEIIRQDHQLGLDRGDQRDAIAIRKIRAADRVAEQHVAENAEIQGAADEHHMARRMARAVQHLEGLAADGDDVAFLQPGVRLQSSALKPKDSAWILML